MPEERVAIVTGAASGIGRATALLFNERGHSIAVADWNAEGARETAARLTVPERALVHTLDVRDATEVSRLVEATVARFGRLDVLVAAAGIGDGGRVDHLSEEDWDRVVDISLKGTFLCCRAVIPELRRAGGGAIVTFGSVLGRSVIPGTAPYSAAKAGVELLTRAMAIDHAREGIRVNCILPGSTDTPLMWLGVSDEERPNVRAVVESEVPMGRVADPIEIASAVFFLASDEASFVTGASLIVDGGTSARLASTY